MLTSNSQIPAWFWDRPLRQPVIGRRKSVLACVTLAPLDLPANCCRCGKPTGESRAVRVIECSKGEAGFALAEIFGGHAGHIARVVRFLTRQKIVVPNCPACWTLRRWGMAAGFVLIAFAVAAFIGLATMDHDAKLRTPDWIICAIVAGALLLGFLGGGMAALFRWRAIAVLVYHNTRKNSLYYEFWSPDYQKYLEKTVKDGSRKFT